MFNQEQLILLINTLNGLTYRPGQSGLMIKIEEINQILTNELEKVAQKNKE